MRRAATVAILLAALGAAALASAQGQGRASPPSISFDADRKPLVQGEPFELTIAISTESESDPQVRLPVFAGLRVLSQSESHPMSFSFSFGFGKQSHRQTNRQSIYRFVLVADRSGRYTLDPVLVTVDGRQFKSEPYVLDVVGGGGAPQGSAGTGDPAPLPPADTDQEGAEPEPAEEVDLAGARFDPDYFVQVAVDRNETSVGGMIVATLYLYTAWRISDVDVVREPGTEGFWVETLLAGQQRLRFETVTVGGKTFERAVLRKLALFPIEPGELTIAPPVVDLEVRRGGFFSRRKTVKRSAPPVAITVRELPTEGQPPGFRPSNVGRFVFKGEVDRTEVEAGEPVTLTLEVRGRGNLRNLELPEVGEVEGFKVYAPESEVEIHQSRSTVEGRRASRTLMIPKGPGKYEIPAVTWSFYDPEAGEYRTVGSPKKTISVEPGSSIAAPSAGASPVEGEAPSDIERLNRRLRSIATRADLEIGGRTPPMARPWFLAATLGAPLLFLAIALASRTRRRMAEQREKGRSKRADAVARRRLDDLRRRAGDLSPEEFFGELQRILVGFLEDRLEVPVAGDTMAELEERLLGRGFDGGLASRVASEMETCDFARFARSGGGPTERPRALEEMRSLISDLAAVEVSPPPEEDRR